MNVVRTEYSIENGKPVVWVFQRDPKGIKTILKDEHLIPYFYALPGETTNFRTDGKFYKTIDDITVKKVCVNTPDEVPKIRDLFTKTWEADVVFQNRFLCDSVDKIEPTHIKKLYADIEVDVGKRLPDVALAQEQITCMSFYDNLEDIYTTFVQRSDLAVGKVSTIFDDRLHEIHYFRNELDMLRAFIKWFKLVDPDLITGWNLIRFDLTYLINRTKLLGLNPGELSPMGSTYIRRYESEKGKYGKSDSSVVIKGISIIDLYDAYRRNTYSGETSYTLDYIGKKVVGVGKTESGDSIHYLWQHELDRLIKYNTTDVKISRLIDEKMGLIDFIDELHNVCFCQHEDVMSMSRLADAYILRLFHGRKVFPTKTSHEHIEYEGALVNSWAKGMYDNVVSFDIRSLYPSAIVVFNLSPETFSEKGDIHVNNLVIDSTKQGFLPETILTLFKERARYKQLMKQVVPNTTDYNIYDMRQKAYKIIMNALYGQTAFAASRIYDPRVADTTTFIGRNLITWSKNFLESKGNKVLYLDTDGIFFLSKGGDLTNVETTRQELNASYKDFCLQYGVKNNIFEMEQKFIYRKAFFGSAKKRYSGAVIEEEGKKVDYLQTVGFETRRSDSSSFSRKLQETIFEMLLHQDKGKDDVLRYLCSEIDRIRKGEFTFAEIGIPKGISKNIDEYGKIVIEDGKVVPDEYGKAKRIGVSGNIRGADYAQEVLGHELSSKPKMIYVLKLPEHLPDKFKGKEVNTICFDDDDQIPPGVQIDVETMLVKSVRSKVVSIFDALGWKMTELEPHWRGRPQKGSNPQMNLF